MHTHIHLHMNHENIRTDADAAKVYSCQSWSCMGWLRLVGSLTSQVSLAKELYKTDDILQKRPIILRSLLHVATPYRKRHLKLQITYQSQPPHINMCTICIWTHTCQLWRRRRRIYTYAYYLYTDPSESVYDLYTDTHLQPWATPQENIYICVLFVYRHI